MAFNEITRDKREIIKTSILRCCLLKLTPSLAVLFLKFICAIESFAHRFLVACFNFILVLHVITDLRKSLSFLSDAVVLFRSLVLQLIVNLSEMAGQHFRIVQTTIKNNALPEF
jgi:hypothetical protein